MKRNPFYKPLRSWLKIVVLFEGETICTQARVNYQVYEIKHEQ